MPRSRTQAILGAVERAKVKGQNLSEDEVQRRLRGGVLFLLMALACAIVLEKTGAPWTARAFLFFPFYLATHAFFVAVHRSCGLSAFRGQRATCEGLERIADPKERQECLCLGKRQLMQSLVSAAAVTALFVFIG